MTTTSLRRELRKHLPEGALLPAPTRLLLIVPHLTLIPLLSIGMVYWVDWWPIRVLLSLILGILYSSLFFFGHEVAHGSVVKSKALGDFLTYFTHGVFLVSPYFWRVWHNQVHHGYTNRYGYDPDNYGTLHEYDSYMWTRLAIAFAPGSGRLISVLSLFTGFTMHAQGVLWVKSYRLRGSSRLRRWRAAVDSGLMLLFWCLVGVTLGPYLSLFVIIIPMMIANFCIMSYIFTNHLLRPLGDINDPLKNSMGVTTLWILDKINFHFSHHIEHHLFPSLSSQYYPILRERLSSSRHQEYLAPPHWRALLMVFRTPRIHDNSSNLVDPYRGISLPIKRVEAALCSSRAEGQTSEAPEVYDVE